MILDYLVVGGGIVGASVSYYLATLVPNAKIMLVDAGTVGGGCTGMSAGTVLCPGEASKMYEARCLYSQLGVYHEIGALQIATDEREVNYLRSLLPSYQIANWLTPKPREFVVHRRVWAVGGHESAVVRASAGTEDFIFARSSGKRW